MFVVHPDTKLLQEVTFQVTHYEGSVIVSCATSIELGLIHPHTNLDGVPEEGSLIYSIADIPKKQRNKNSQLSLIFSQKQNNNFAVRQAFARFCHGFFQVWGKCCSNQHNWCIRKIIPYDIIGYNDITVFILADVMPFVVWFTLIDVDIKVCVENVVPHFGRCHCHMRWNYHFCWIIVVLLCMADVIAIFAIFLIHQLCWLEQHFPQTWKKPWQNLAKACLTAKLLFCFWENIKDKWCQTEWETSIHKNSQAEKYVQMRPKKPATDVRPKKHMALHKEKKYEYDDFRSQSTKEDKLLCYDKNCQADKIWLCSQWPKKKIEICGYPNQQGYIVTRTVNLPDVIKIWVQGDQCVTKLLISDLNLKEQLH